jgi:hypothetical protein
VTMRWTEIDERFPDPQHTAIPQKPDARGWLPDIATHLTRGALGLPTRPIPRESIRAVIAAGTEDRQLLRGDARHPWGAPWLEERPAQDLLSLFALIAAIEKDWDAVAAFTGGRALGARVIIEKVFGSDATALARHLATAARGRLPARQVLAAMRDVRTQFAADAFGDARAGVLATRLFIGEIVAASDTVAATRAWLDGEDIEIVDSRVVRSVADGEDPRVKIFERYLDELGDDAGIDRELARHAPVDPEPWARYHHRERQPFEDAVIRAWMARRPLPADWDALVDPVVACWLSGSSRASISIGQRFLDLERPVWVGDPAPAFKPGKFFKDDVRKLTKYLEVAVQVGARLEDVMPAWLDFLARRSPATTTIGGEPLRWKFLLELQQTITHRIGKQPREHTGGALRSIVTGV